MPMAKRTMTHVQVVILQLTVNSLPVNICNDIMLWRLQFSLQLDLPHLLRLQNHQLHLTQSLTWKYVVFLIFLLPGNLA